MCGSWYFPTFLLRVIDPNEHCLLNIPCITLWFPMYDGETVWTNWMPCGIAVVMDGGWSPEVLSYSVL